MGMNTSQLATDLGGILNEQLEDLAHGARDDLQEFGAAIAQDLAAVIADRDQEGLEEVKAQMRALAEAKRIDVDSVAWETLGKVMDVAFKAAVAALGAVL